MAILVSIALGSFFAAILFFSNLINPRKTKSLGKSKPIPGLTLLGLICHIWSLKKLMYWIGSIGKIVQCKALGIGVRAALINDYEMAKLMFRNPVFNGRNASETILYFSKGPNGIMNTDGKKWAEQRRFCHQHLKQFGFGGKTMEKFIKIEIDQLLQNWSDQKDKVFSPNKDFYLPVLSSIWVILAGERATSQDSQLTQLVLSVYDSFRKFWRLPEVFLLLAKLKLETVLRIAKYIPIFPGVKAYIESVTNLHVYFKNTIEAKKQKFNVDRIPNNLIDAYLLEIQKTTDPDSEFFGEKGETNLLAVMVDFFVAGGETTATTLAWAMLHLIRDPSIQENIKNEIKLVVGADRRPTLLDLPNCPFTEAFLLEVLRVSPAGFSSLPHVTSQNTNFGDFCVPKDTILLLNIWSIHQNPQIWGDPQTFRPERFLTKDACGWRVVKQEAMCAFSLGPRRCIGEQVARDTLFLFVSAICQRFTLKADPAFEKTPPLRDLNSAMHVPDTFSIVAIARTS